MQRFANEYDRREQEALRGRRGRRETMYDQDFEYLQSPGGWDEGEYQGGRGYPGGREYRGYEASRYEGNYGHPRDEGRGYEGRGYENRGFEGRGYEVSNPPGRGYSGYGGGYGAGYGAGYEGRGYSGYMNRRFEGGRGTSGTDPNWYGGARDIDWGRSGSRYGQREYEGSSQEYGGNLPDFRGGTYGLAGYSGSGQWSRGMQPGWGSPAGFGSQSISQNRGFWGKGPKGYQRSDQRIQEDISERLMQHPDIDASEIEVRVQSGEVMLSGTVDERNAKRLAEDLADDVAGVKQVHNQIRVSLRPDTEHTAGTGRKGKEHETELAASGKRS